MEHTVMDDAIMRIRQMEQIFDALQEAAAEPPSAIREEPALQGHLQELMQYYESGQWLQDYELDEAGRLPQDLKRGVLAQDAVYNFLDGLHAD